MLFKITKLVATFGFVIALAITFLCIVHSSGMEGIKHPGDQGEHLAQRASRPPARVIE